MSRRPTHAARPELVDCPRRKSSMRAALESLGQWVPRLVDDGGER
jgi:hypothetical protein